MWPFRKKMSVTEDGEARLAAACAGLTYPSERDAPFDVFRWPASAGSAVAAVGQRSPVGATIETVGLDHLFTSLTGDPRFARLREAMRSTLRDPTVVRVKREGDAEVQIYFIGQTSINDWLGLHTVSIET